MRICFNFISLLFLVSFPQALFAQTWLYEEAVGIDLARDSLLEKKLGNLNDSVLPWVGMELEPLSDSLLLKAPPKEVLKKEPPKISSQNNEEKITAGEIAADGKTAVMQGMVLGAEDGKPLAKATIILRQDTLLLRTESDESGMFRISGIAPGGYNLRVVRKGYTTMERERFILSPGERRIEEFSLDRRVARGKLFEVQKPRTDASAELLSRRQEAGVVMEGVTAEQIAKSTDSDAGAIAKRVTGTSVVGGKYVFVRGLGERYTNMTLNGLPVPTPEKDRRVVPQDLFPAAALESFAIYKAFTPDLQPDFGGGSVALETRGFPENDFFRVSVGSSATDYLGDEKFLDVGNDRLEYPTSNAFANYLGLESQSMQIPKGMPTYVTSLQYQNPAQRADFAALWRNNWAIDTAKILPNQSISLSGGRVWSLDNGAHTGFLGNVAFKNSYNQLQQKYVKLTSTTVMDTVVRIRNGQEFRFTSIVYDTVNGRAIPLTYITPGVIQNRSVGEYGTTTSGLLNWGYESRNHKLWAKSLYAALSEQTTRFYPSYQVPGISMGQSNQLEDRFTMEYERRDIAVLQLGGGHYVGRSVLDSLSWAAGIARSEGNSPDAKKYYFANFPEENTLTYETKAPWGTRQFQTFWENGFSMRNDLFLVVPPEWSSRELFLEEGKILSNVRLPRMRSGWEFNFRERKYDIITYMWDQVSGFHTVPGNYRFIDSIMDPDNRAVHERFRSFLGAYDGYEAKESKFALHSMLEQSFSLWGVPTDIRGGGRYEYYHLDFIAPFSRETVISNPSLRLDSAVILEPRDHLFYPSASLTFEFIPRTKSRILWSQTLVRPEFRERVPSVFFNSEEDRDQIGNPDLLDTRIDNFDFRFEWYLPHRQLFSFSLFHKDFDHPVEPYLNATLNPSVKMIQSADGAFVQGVEVELDISPYRLWTNSADAPVSLHGVGLYANAAWIRSYVRLDTTRPGVELLTSRKRAMVGQSPWVYNFKATREQKWENGMSLLNALLYNVAGPRIRELGVDGEPDLYEESFHGLDFMSRFSLGRHQWNFSVKNLLNSSRRITGTEVGHKKNYEIISDERRDSLYRENQKVPIQTISSYKPGMEFSVGYSLSW